MSVITTLPSTRTGEVNIDEAIESFLPWALGEGYDIGSEAEGMCSYASDEFLHKLAEYGIEGEIEYYEPLIELDVEDYPHELSRWVCYCHYAVRVGDWVIDWTARQFDEEAPFPSVWKGVRREWRNVS